MAEHESRPTGAESTDGRSQSDRPIRPWEMGHHDRVEEWCVVLENCAFRETHEWRKRKLLQIRDHLRTQEDLRDTLRDLGDAVADAMLRAREATDV